MGSIFTIHIWNLFSFDEGKVCTPVKQVHFINLSRTIQEKYVALVKKAEYEPSCVEGSVIKFLQMNKERVEVKELFHLYYATSIGLPNMCSNNLRQVFPLPIP